MAPKLAGTIRIENGSITIDGDELPWYVAAGSISVDLTDTKGDIDRVTLTLYADHVEVDHGRKPEAVPDQVFSNEGERLLSGAVCGNHQPKQHRDGKPPWCKTCGLTKTGYEPVFRIKGDRP